MEKQISKSDRILAMIIHLGSFVGSFIIPLIIFLLKRDESRFIDRNGREVINAHINAIILSISILIVGTILTRPELGMSQLLGIFFFAMLLVIAFVYPISFIIGAIKAYNGKCFRYPVIFKFLVKRNN